MTSAPPPDASSWEEAPANICGRAHALTTISKVRPAWTVRLRVRLAIRRALPRFVQRWAARGLRRLSFIHFARWSLIRDLPAAGGGRQSLAYTYLLFESNFNGDWQQYIDAFSYVLTRRMKRIWGSSYGFPQPVPAGPFKDYIRRGELAPGHYYSAYPDHSTTTVVAALQLRPQVEAAARAARELPDEAFAARYAELLDDVQHWL